MRFPVGWTTLPLALVVVHGVVLGGAGSARGAVEDGALVAAVRSPQRTPKFVARDPARHPVAELTFFGLRPNATVVEIWPGGGYWTEILAPYLRAHGRLVEALPAGDKEEEADAAAFRAKLAKNPALFAGVTTSALGPGHFDIAPPGSADFVLTFRNIHNWMGSGTAPQTFAAFYKALKPGGILGVEEHRGDPALPQDPKADDGYVRQDYAIALATKAGFHLVGSSEIDANPRDTKHWPKGVWTLPPVFALGATDHARYAAIGEADNFVLKFQK
jgi:predicted methyltransferase